MMTKGTSKTNTRVYAFPVGTVLSSSPSALLVLSVFCNIFSLVVCVGEIRGDIGFFSLGLSKNNNVESTF